MKKLLPVLIILIAVGAGGAVFYAKRGDKEPTVTTLTMSRGTIIDGVRATGSLQAVTTVTVGTQVSGIVQDLPTDFNDIVKKGQVIARLDPSILQTQVETAEANLATAQANLERQKVAVVDAKAKLTRATELEKRQLINKVDLENADVTLKQADAQLKSTESSIVQAEAAVNKAKVDLDHTIITAPIDGIVIKRSVDKGQTVNAGMSAPELFIIAADLTKMQVNANIDETDVGRMRPGQDVNFTVDAYPTETFHGSVKQVRLNPTTVQNVVTYSTVIDVPNPELKLKPGMTASVTIQIARRDNALRIPNAAIRFRPTADVFAALHQPVPPELERGFGGRGNRGGQGGRAGGAPNAGAPSGGPVPSASATAAPAANAQAKKSGSPAGGANAAPSQQAQNGQGQGGRPGGGGGDQAGQGGGQGGRGGFSNMTPEERAAAEKRRAERLANGGGRGQGGGNFGGGGGRGGQGGGNFPGGGGQGGGNFQRNGAGGPGGGNRNGGQPGGAADKPAASGNATTIDALFAPLVPVQTRGRAWLYVDKQLKSVDLRLGISDGTYTEVLNDPAELPATTEFVVTIVTPDMASRPTGQTNNQNGNPLMPAQRGRGPGGGGPGPGR